MTGDEVGDRSPTGAFLQQRPAAAKAGDAATAEDLLEALEGEAAEDGDG